MDAPSDLIQLPAGLSARAMRLDDVDAVTGLVAACELHDDGVIEIDREDIVVDWARPSFDLAADSLGVFDGDRLVSEAELYKGSRAEINIHPAARGRGIGSALLTWTETGAVARGVDSVSQTTSDHDAAAAELLEARGYRYGHTSWILRIEHDERPADPALPPGVGFRDFEPARDARETYQVIEDAFNEWRRQPATFEDWAALSIERPSFEPWQMIVVTDQESGAIVGATFMLAYESEGGWVEQVATRASHRHRGIGRAMLQQAFGVFWDRGERIVGLNTDSRTGALGMYEKVGMHVTRSYTNRVKTLP